MPSSDLTVEVASPSDRIPRRVEKAYEYLTAGIHLVRLFDPDDRAMLVVRPGQPISVVPDDASLGGEDVLAGFCLPLNEIEMDFVEDEPSACARV